MLDLEIVNLALRARLQTVTIAATPTMDLSATSAGYARLTGSFVTEGYAEGMEVTPTGFPSEIAPRIDVATISKVEPLLLTIAKGRTPAVSASGRSLRVGLPGIAAFDKPVTRVPDRPYFVEQFSPSIAPTVGGYTEDRGLYALTYLSETKYGKTPIQRAMLAIRELFTPGTLIGTGTNQVRIRGLANTPPSQIYDGDGWSWSTFKPEWAAFTRNIIAA